MLDLKNNGDVTARISWSAGQLSRTHTSPTYIATQLWLNLYYMEISQRQNTAFQRLEIIVWRSAFGVRRSLPLKVPNSSIVVERSENRKPGNIP